MLVNYIYDEGIDLSEHKGYKSYDIPVQKFKELVDESLFYNYNYKELRLELSKYTVGDKKAFRCSYGRTDNTIKNGKTSQKVISLIAEVAQPFLDKLREDD